MNIVAANATPLPDAGPASTTATSTGVDADLGDPAVASGAVVQNFGQILSDSLAKGRAAAQGSTDQALIAAAMPSTAAYAGVQRIASDAAEPTDKRLASDLPGAAVIGAAIGATAAKVDALDPTKPAKPGESDDPAADPVSTDLSSQLALVSQWAGLQPPPGPTIAAGAAPRPAADPLASSLAVTSDGARAVSGKKGAAEAAVAVDLGQVPVATLPVASEAAALMVNGGAGNGGAVVAAKADKAKAAEATPVTMGAAVDLGQVQAAALPVAFEAAAFAANRNARATGAADDGAGATAKTDPTKAGEATPTTTSEIRTDAVDKLFALAGVAHAGTASDPSSTSNQFVSQNSTQVSNAQNALAAVPTPVAAALREPVGSGAWSNELGQTAIRMATNDLQNASLRLNPEHLGPLDVQMRVDNGVAHMQFTAAHAETRQALESSRTTLDQMFSEQGIKLGDWSVGNSNQNGAFARNFGESPQGDGARASGADADAGAGDPIPMTATTRPLGLVDTFA